MMTNEQIGMILSICGMLVTVFSFQLKKKSLLLLAQTVGSAFYLVSYIFSKGGIAVLLNVIFILRNFLFIAVKENKERAMLLCLLLCLSYVVSYICYILFNSLTTSEKWWNLLPVIGSFFGTFAITKTNANALRAWKSLDSISWLAFNLRIGLGALGGIIGEIFNLTSIGIAILRFKKEENTFNEKD
jgi:hypothetical protein